MTTPAPVHPTGATITSPAALTPPPQAPHPPGPP